jgi:2-polyprenyl-3-methyl-5-hydroxy-6-metoxy-1,4-benzoquinol methylase
MFFGGMYQEIGGGSGFLRSMDPILQAFRHGGGMPQSAYDNHMWEGLERFTGGWFENHLIQEWIPALPEVKAKLEAGALVADVGSGNGRALIKLAQAFPNSRYVGYDIFEPSVVTATTNAKEAGVGEIVRFEYSDVSKGLPEAYDVITTFDVVHDAIDPRGLVRSIKEGLKPGGTYVCLDINCSDKLEENFGPVGTIFYTISILYCMTTSLAHNGEGLGTAGLPESKLRELAIEAGFSSVRVVASDPFNNLYEVKA